MANAKQKVQRHCLVCDVSFQGTPKATRCDDCRQAGRKVPRDQQMARRKKPLPEKPKPQPKPTKPKVESPLHTRVCHACGDDFTTRKPKAKRCDPCISENRSAKSKTCPSCDEKFPAVHSGDFCRSCNEAGNTFSGWDSELTEKLEAELREERKAKRRKRAQGQLAALDALSKKPRGYPPMTKQVSQSALEVLWLELCWSDGQLNALTRDTEIDDETKRRLLTTYLRLRLKGFHSHAVAKIDPVRMMAYDERQIDEALEELPKVDLEQPQDDLTFDPFEDLSDELREEVISFQEEQNRQEMAQRLGLAS